MLEVQARTGFEYDWKFTRNETENMWYAWFTEPVELDVSTGEIVNG